MGLQKFKLNIANTVVSAENSSLQSMGADHLLDLFNNPETPTAANVPSRAGSKAAGLNIDGFDLGSSNCTTSDDGSYDDYNVQGFLKSMNAL